MAEVVTGEAVVLDVPCARFPSRALALGIDLLTQLAVLLILGVIAGLAYADGGLNAASSAAVVITMLVLVVVGYPVIWETMTSGRSPGKFALGLRVVSDDGSPERFRQALVRGLASIVEIWGMLGCPALICSLLTARGKRLGDLFAGTFVIQQRLPRPGRAAAPFTVHPWLAQWAASLELSGLADQTAETARRYLARVGELTPPAQAHLGQRIAAAVSAQVGPPPPPGTPPEVYLAAVLAERSRREHTRLTLTAPGAATAFASVTPAAPPPVTTPPRPPSPPPATRLTTWALPGETYGGVTRAGREGQESATHDSEPEPGPAPGPGYAPGGFVPPA